MRLCFSLGLILILLTACNLNQAALPTANTDNVIFVTATSALPTPDADGVVFITATPQLIVTATQNVADVPANTPVPTAVLPAADTAQPAAPTQADVAPTTVTSQITVEQPEAQLTQANTFLRNGYFIEAMEIYQALLLAGDNVSAEVRSGAAFKRGQAALREGQFNDSVTALSLLINEFPEDTRKAQAYFLRGDAYLGLGGWEAAIQDFQQYLALRPGLADSYAYERIADAQLALGQIEQAPNNYQLALNAGRPLVPELILREKLAQLYLSSGLNRVDDAIAQYDAILAVAQNAPYRASIDLAAAQALLNSGNTTAGLPRVRQVFDSYPGTTSAYQAMQILLENNIQIDVLERGKAHYTAENYNEAINAFNEYSSSNTLETIPAELYLLLGRAYRAIGNSQAALVAFQTLIEQYPGDPLLGDALLEQGRTRFLNGNNTDAINTYLAVADTYGYLTDAAAEAMWRAGYLYAQEGEATLSRQTFIDLADKYPTNEWALNGLLLAASAAIEAENLELAEQLYSRIAGLATGEEKSAAYFWLGKLALRQGNTQAATDAFGLAIQAAPDSYYAARSADIQVGREPFQPPTTYQFAIDEAAAKAEAEDWIRLTYNITQTGDLATPSATLLADPRLIRGQELWALAAYGDALDEFDALMDEARDAGDMLTLYQLAVLFKNEGIYYSSVIAAADVIRASGLSTLAAPAFLARMRYPDAYLEVIQDVVADENIDPLLVLALMRHESLYNTFATAAAGEKGLTQVIPSTAEYIAGELNWPDYQHTDLFRPYAGISFGVFYLDENLGRFSRSVIPALAAYNAGPGRAQAWLNLSGDDPDLFMTAIQIDSTRLYIQRIYSYHSIYRELYGA